MNKASLIITALVSSVVAIGIGVDWRRSDSRSRTLWQQVVIPGALSQPHAFLSNNCAACHSPVKGVEPALCIACHADNTALLQRQPTAFHANVQVCSGCHVEHQGTSRMPTTMDHSLLARVGHRELAAARLAVRAGFEDSEAAPSPFNRPSRRELQVVTPGASAGEMEQGCGGPGGCARDGANVDPPIARGLPAEHPGVAADESMLNCASCHATKDRHQGLFGANCVQCHRTAQWAVAEFRHPSPRSTECSQCHQPPPSHNMMHFSMMSVPIARQPDAKVNQCYLCHQTTVWNDIKGLGWKKIH